MEYTFSNLDWLLISIYILFMLGAGVYIKKNTEAGISGFFNAGRRMPWWLAGVSMVATTFSADTPLAVTGIVASYGIAGNWIWWNFMFSGIFTVFLFSKLWYRAGVATDVEFIELRYFGKPAKYLRCFRAIYLAIPINCIILGWVTTGMSKVLTVISGVNQWEIIILLYSITTIYIIISGLWGVAITDFIQFFIALGGAIILMIYAVSDVGGVSEISNQFSMRFEDHSYFSFFPINNPYIPIQLLLVWVCMQWWCTWYPGAEPGGGGYIAQRMFSTKSDKDAVKSTLLFNLAHYVIRPWPWIIVALCAMLIFPEMSYRFKGEKGIITEVSDRSVLIALDDDTNEEINYEHISPLVKEGDIVKKGDMLFDSEEAYPLMIMRLLPPGLRAILIVSFIAAFMSTVSTHLNWGSSYIVNDVYARFIRNRNSFESSQQADNHFLFISRFSCVLIAILSIVVSYFFNSVKDGWELLISLGAGTGLVYMLRWYWWRINAWSEISAMIAAFVGSFVFSMLGFEGPEKIIITTLFTTYVWVAVTLSTKPEPESVLSEFYNLVRPASGGWGRFAGNNSISIRPMLVNVVISVIIVNTALFGIGNLFFLNYFLGLPMILFSTILLNVLIKRINSL